MHHSVEKQPEISRQETSSLYEAITRAKHVTVEFGTGDMALFELHGKQSFDADNLYVGVNLDPKQHEHLAKKVESIDGFALLSEKNQDGNIDRLTLPDGSVDAVFMANVFSEPDSEHIMEPFKHSDGLYRGSSDIHSKIETLNEAKRLLKGGGRVIILENNTPYQARLSGNYTSMVTLLEDGGFHVVAAMNQRDGNWSELVSHFAQPAEQWSSSSYLVVAQKPEQ